MTAAQHTSEKSNRKRQDRILYCGRCGVSFLWTAEEQAVESIASTDAPTSDTPSKTGSGWDAGARQAATPGRLRPQFCPGCRLILPHGGRERGLVKWYNRRKRFGFITRRDQPDLFVHGSSITDNRPLSPDELVEFSVDENDRGLTAVDVVRLSTPTHPAP